MKILPAFILSLFFSITVFAQRTYFIYLQSENGNPFYVKMADKVYSSLAPGYLIMSDLRDSNYFFSIGFPSSQKESKFNISIRGKDKGFLIRNSDNGFNLIDLQTSSVIMPFIDQSNNIAYERRSDMFTVLLSKAAGDSSFLLVPIQTKEDVVLETIKPKEIEKVNEKKEDVIKNDTVISKPIETENIKATQKTSNDKIEVKDKKNVSGSTILKQPAPKKEEDSITTLPVVEKYARSVVKKHSESSTSEGFGLVFYDNYNGAVDTIRLLIPNPKIFINQPDKLKNENQGEFLEIKKDTAENKIKTTPKFDCPSIATDNDFFRLRKNMAAEKTEEAMVSQAKKYFKNKCFSTEQLKNLSALFLTSSGKYQFFDAAYPHVTDIEQFSTLGPEIKDEYYLKRFKALTGN